MNWRITPADAGKTSSGSFFCPRYWDHPRGCGENRAYTAQRVTSAGSPPRMRGKPVPVFGHRAHNRDHPRGCGENLTVCRVITFRPGSPPRMRGKRVSRNIATAIIGITPADAGKTGACCRYRTAKQDHPRGCGENRHSVSCGFLEVGSPPRMRGKHCDAAGCLDDCRITPADAGKTKARKTFRTSY